MEGAVQEFKRRKEDLNPNEKTSPHTLELVNEAVLLAKYCLDHGLLSQPQVLERLLILQGLAEANKLSGKDISEIVELFDQATLIAGDVTPDSLQETEKVREGYWRSRTGRHLLMLWGITGLIGLLIFLYSMLEYRVSYFDLSPSEDVVDNHLFWVRLQHYASFLVPFTYGALGACAFLLRDISQKLKARQFDASDIPQHWNRLIIGALSGGLIVMFVNQIPESGNSSAIQISEGALGFLAGYSIEFLFSTLDRILNALLPNRSESTTRPTQNSQKAVKQHKLVNRYTDMIESTDDPVEKKVLEKVVRDLKA